MATPNHSRHGSMGYYPRKRARSIIPHIRSWPEIKEGPKLQGFVGFKAGMTHALFVDYRKSSTTAGSEVASSVTVIEVPPLKVVGIRLYGRDTYGEHTIGEVYDTGSINELKKILPISKEYKPKELDGKDAYDVNVLVLIQNEKVKAISKKVPDLTEIRIGGGTIKERIDYAKSILGKEVTFDSFSKSGKFVDIIAITKGKGFQGHVKRWGVKLLPYKNRKHRRMIGTLGPWHPDWVRNTVPQAGQMGFHQRTEFNKRVLYYGKPEEKAITPKGGFLNYGEVVNSYILVHGSIPGSTKRIIKLRDPARQFVPDVEKVGMTYVSVESKQGA
ncbi:MAG: 50S ribosomal protein L3 [Candidatus Thermoplasmatota archaeon]|nr:50S ribosomal protein L3 [Candidatus Thermoplasmatota archaeon]MCL5790246.1 50S ribosomal protein L3 [Candidatus Thermoplasmatota archaeon]